jgi:hypothetical protein
MANMKSKTTQKPKAADTGRDDSLITRRSIRILDYKVPKGRKLHLHLRYTTFPHLLAQIPNSVTKITVQLTDSARRQRGDF